MRKICAKRLTLAVRGDEPAQRMHMMATRRKLPLPGTMAHRQSQTGLPILRGLVVDFPAEPAARLVDDQFLLGDALMVAPGRNKIALPRLPDLMEAVGGQAPLSAACAAPTAEQAARGLRQSMAYRALAFADATRAAATAPAPWGKAHARVAEAAYEIGVQCWARGDRHGVHCMRQIVGNEYRLAAEIEPSGGFITCAMRAEKELLVPPPRRTSDADDDDSDGESPLAQLKQQLRAGEQRRVGRERVRVRPDEVL